MNDSWSAVEDLVADYASQGESRRFGVPPYHGLQVFVDRSAGSFGVLLRIALEERFKPSRLTRILSLSPVEIDGETYACLSCDDIRYSTAFFNLAAGVAQRFDPAENNALHSIDEALREHRALLEARLPLGRNELVGLLGELLVLSALCESGQPDPVGCWCGPDQDAHDFRLHDVELEVKTTTRGRRVHSISSPQQLQHSAGYGLFLISIMLREGPGFSLRSACASVAERLAAAERSKFFSKIERVTGFEPRRSDAEELDMSFVLASTPVAVHVSSEIAVLNSDRLSQTLGSNVARVSRLVHDFDCEGLGSSPDKVSGGILSVNDWSGLFRGNA